MSAMRFRAALTTLLTIGTAAFLAAQVKTPPPQTRDLTKAPLAPGRGSIAGLVMSDQSPSTPIVHATITITTADGDPAALAFTDARGAFVAPRLPAGRYVVVATKPAYVRAPYGAKHYDRPGTPVTLGDGQALTGIDITMTRGAVLAGTVTDDGAPIPGVLVRVSQYRTTDGQRTLVPVPQAGSPTSVLTDDRGAYRIFGLPAGEYVVSAAPRPLANGDIRQMTPADIQSVRQAMQAANAAAAAPVRPEAVTVTYASVYYPNTTVASDATVLGLHAGEERTGIDLSMQLVRTAHIDGIVVTPPGVSPQNVQLLMISNGASGGAGPIGLIALSRATPGPDGSFSYAGIAPGQYTITARAAAPGGNGANANVAAGRGVPPGGGPQLWGQAEVSVNGANLAGVSITLQPGMTISGRVAADPVAGPAPDLSRARISLVPASNGNGVMIGVPIATVDGSGRFTIAGVVPGRYRLTAALAGAGGDATWTSKSAMLGGHDALDVPFDVVPNQDLTDGVVTFTSATQGVSGKLQDASGRPATEFTIVLFPADREAWSSTRRVRTARPATDGHFDFANVPAGDYRLAAVVDVAPNEVTDPAFLSEIATASITITLHDGEKKVQDVRLAGGG